MQFLRDCQNKTELNTFLAENLSAMTYPSGRQLFVTSNERVLSNCGLSMSDSDHEEADTRLVVHIKDALTKGINNFVIASSDTDVIIILLSVYHKLRSDYDIIDIVVDFGIKQEHRRISINNLALSLGQTRCKAMNFFHAFTGFDTTLAFKGLGKKTAFQAYRAYPDVESVFAGFHTDPFQNLEEDDEKFKIIQRFAVLMYSRTSLCHSVNDARVELYFERSQDNESIPPTKNALLMHTKRAIYQSGVWSNCIEPQQNLPSPQNFGWQQSRDTPSIWQPLWMTKQEACKELRELLVKCGCKTSVCKQSKRCKCNSVNFLCTRLCSCACPSKAPVE